MPIIIAKLEDLDGDVRTTAVEVMGKLVVVVLVLQARRAPLLFFGGLCPISYLTTLT